jgi:SNF2 family DNA or RNA helicase
VNDGEVRVLVGSTFKLGIGVNVQRKLIAVHHLDVPWRPADMTQREGRIIRQGNENKEVFIYRYITEGSFDAYSWQLLETKQKFISDLLRGFAEVRRADEIDDTVLDYGEVKALAVGNPRIRERVETLNELNKYKTLQAKVMKVREEIRTELSQLPGKIQLQISMVEAAERNLAFITEYHPDEDETAQTKKQKEAERQEFRHELYRALLDNTMETREREFGEYRGFSIRLPAGMKFDKPYVILERDKGRYRVELSGSEVGNLIRIDHFLEKETFEAYLNSLKEGLQNYVSRKKDIERELKREESYTDRIDELTTRLELIDKELGVNKDGK